MTTANDDLKADPVAFLSNNILMISAMLNGLQFQGGVQPLTLKKTTNVGKKGGLAVPVYVLKHHTQESTLQKLDAYWCPYSSNATGTATLHGVFGPSIMFTAAMDGCTFAAGNRTSNGTTSVSHTNMTSQAQFGGVENQRKLQRNVAQGLYGKGAGTTIQAPSDYYTQVDVPGKQTKVATTTFGYRDGKNWVFYSHRYYSEKTQGEFSCTYNWLGCDLISASI